MCSVQSRYGVAGPPMSHSHWPRSLASCPRCVSSRRTSTCPRVCATWPDVTPQTTSGPGSPSRLCSLQTPPPQEQEDRERVCGASVVAVCLTDRLLSVTRWPCDQCYLGSWHDSLQFNPNDNSQVGTCGPGEACMLYTWKKSSTEIGSYRECFKTSIQVSYEINSMNSFNIFFCFSLARRISRSPRPPRVSCLGPRRTRGPLSEPVCAPRTSATLSRMVSWHFVSDDEELMQFNYCTSTIVIICALIEILSWKAL